MACLWLTNKLIHLLKTTFCNKLQGRWRRQIVKDKADPGTLWEKFQTTSIIRSPSKHFYSTSTLKSSVNSSEIIGPRISKVIISKRQAKPLGSRGPGSRWDIYRRRLTWCSETHRRLDPHHPCRRWIPTLDGGNPHPSAHKQKWNQRRADLQDYRRFHQCRRQHLRHPACRLLRTDFAS